MIRAKRFHYFGPVFGKSNGTQITLADSSRHAAGTDLSRVLGRGYMYLAVMRIGPSTFREDEARALASLTAAPLDDAETFKQAIRRGTDEVWPWEYDAMDTLDALRARVDQMGRGSIEKAQFCAVLAHLTSKLLGECWMGMHDWDPRIL